MVRPTRTALILVVAALAALLASGCAFVKPGSLRATQPGGIGPVHVHFEACTIGAEEVKMTPEEKICGPVPDAAREQIEKEDPGTTAETTLAFAIPAGSTAPVAITAVGVGAAPTFTYTRSAEVAAAYARAEREEGDSRPWPPAGSEIVGYVGPPSLDIVAKQYEWSIDTDFGLPPGAAFAGPFTVEVASGGQLNIPETEFTPGRPIECEGEGPSTCFIQEGTATGVTDLKLAPATATAFPGATIAVAFPAALASSAVPPPSLALSAASGLPGSTASPATPAVSGSSATVNVIVPKKAKPGAYPVTVTATAPGGGAVSQGGTLTVVSAKPKPGRIQQLRKQGTVRVAVGVPGAGTLTVSGKGVVKVKRKASTAKRLKMIVKAKGATAAKLAATGRAPVKPKFTFKPANGAAATVPFSLILVRE